MKKIFVKLENSETDLLKLVEYIENVDDSFNISLSSRVNILNYARKMLQSGIVLAHIINGRIAGIIGFYCNNKESKNGYITIASLTMDSQKEGYNARDLFYATNLIAMKNGIEFFSCEAIDRRAAMLYKRIGFTEICQENINNVTHYHLVCDIKDWMSKNVERQITILNWGE